MLIWTISIIFSFLFKLLVINCLTKKKKTTILKETIFLSIYHRSTKKFTYEFNKQTIAKDA